MYVFDEWDSMASTSHVCAKFFLDIFSQMDVEGIIHEKTLLNCLLFFVSCSAVGDTFLTKVSPW